MASDGVMLVLIFFSTLGPFLATGLIPGFKDQVLPRYLLRSFARKRDVVKISIAAGGVVVVSQLLVLTQSGPSIPRSAHRRLNLGDVVAFFDQAERTERVVGFFHFLTALALAASAFSLISHLLIKWHLEEKPLVSEYRRATVDRVGSELDFIHAPRRLYSMAILCVLFSVLWIFPCGFIFESIWPYITYGLLFSGMAIGLGVMSIRQIRRTPTLFKGNPIAVVGIVLGSAGFVVVSICLVVNLFE